MLLAQPSYHHYMKFQCSNRKTVQIVLMCAGFKPIPFCRICKLWFDFKLQKIIFAQGHNKQK